MLHKNICTLNREKSELALSTHVGAHGKFRTRIKNPDGSVTGWSPWFNNLILNQGMDALPDHGGWQSMFARCRRGTGNAPVRRNTNGTGVTLSQSGSTVTASSAFFLSTDVGAIIKYGLSGSAGAEAIITGYTDSQHVTVSTSASVSSTDAVVWLVQQTTMSAGVDETYTTFESDLTTFDATGGGSGIPTVTFRRGYQFAAVGSTVTFKELALGWYSGNLNSNFSRVLVPGSGDTLTAGQYYQVEYSLTLQLPDGVAPVSVGDSSHPSGDPWNTAGTFMLEYHGFPTGATLNTGDRPLDPANGYGNFIEAITAPWTQASVVSNTQPTLTVTDCNSHTQDAYSAGTYQVVRHCTFNLGTANVTWYGIAGGYYGYKAMSWTIKFTTPLAKDASHTLTFTHTLSWSRVFTN